MQKLTLIIDVRARNSSTFRSAKQEKKTSLLKIIFIARNEKFEKETKQKDTEKHVFNCDRKIT